MAAKEIFLLGNPSLYEISTQIKREELEGLTSVVEDLHDTLMEFRKKYGIGRAIAAPQIGMIRRLVYMHIEQPVVFINPALDQKSAAMMEVWDDCMSFPDLLVKVRRHRTCRITYRDLEWQQRSMMLDGSLSELLQHECDHLDGILAVSRAIDGKSFALRADRFGFRDNRRD